MEEYIAKLEAKQNHRIISHYSCFRSNASLCCWNHQCSFVLFLCGEAETERTFLVVPFGVLIVGLVFFKSLPVVEDSLVLVFFGDSDLALRVLRFDLSE